MFFFFLGGGGGGGHIHVIDRGKKKRGSKKFNRSWKFLGGTCLEDFTICKETRIISL